MLIKIRWFDESDGEWFNIYCDYSDYGEIFDTLEYSGIKHEDYVVEDKTYLISWYDYIDDEWQEIWCDEESYKEELEKKLYEEYFEKLCYDGIKKRYNEIIQGLGMKDFSLEEEFEEVKERFVAMGFDYVYAPSTPIETTIVDLKNKLGLE